VVKPIATSLMVPILLQVLSVAIRNGLKSRSIRSSAPGEAPPPACCSPFNDNAVEDAGSASASAAAAGDELPFPVLIDIASSVLLVPLQRVCMQPACRVIAQARVMLPMVVVVVVVVVLLLVVLVLVLVLVLVAVVKEVETAVMWKCGTARDCRNWSRRPCSTTALLWRTAPLSMHKVIREAWHIKS
jgi:hypothetical protein